MTAPLVRGWCPGALRPMESGDGLVVRVRPRCGRFTSAELLSLCDAAEAFGSGTMEFTSRANLQLRGVRPDTHAPLLEALASCGLLDRDEAVEARRNILVAPLWAKADGTAALEAALVAALPGFPDLPRKFGVALDLGPNPALGDASGDIRVERGTDGGRIVRADGAATGVSVRDQDTVDVIRALAQWFAAARGTQGPRRMARLIAALPLPPEFTGTAPAAAAAQLAPGPTPLGPLVGVPFGQIDARILRAAITEAAPSALRLTPWRLLLLENAQRTPANLIDRPDNPILRAHACPGAPACPQASVDTRSAAAALARRLTGTIHVSGCAKGCAWPRKAATTLVGREGRFDLVHRGAPWDEPDRRGLAPAELATLTDGA